MNTDNTSRLGVNLVERIFIEYGWKWREQPISDYGVDAQVEIAVNDRPTGQLIAIQIKSGASYFRTRGEGYVYYGSTEHFDYWSGHCLPVFLVLVNPETQEIVWRRFQAHEANVTSAGWSIEIPKANLLNGEAKAHFEQSVVREKEVQRQQDAVKSIDTGSSALLEAIEGLSDEDKEVRIRILGYSLWFAPLQKTELIKYLEESHSPASIERDTGRLCDAGYLKDIGHHFLPNLDEPQSRKVCEQAMAHVQDEIIQFVEAH